MNRILVFSVLFILAGAAWADSSLGPSAKITVDSSYAGYRTEVLTDGRWYAHGEEVGKRDADRLGNGGNTWVSSISPQALARMAPRPLTRNIARLEEESPGSATVLHWDALGRTKTVPRLADGELATLALPLEAGDAVGVTWPVRHSVDSVAVVLASAAEARGGLILEAHDGVRWVAIATGLQLKSSPDNRRLEWTFEPTASQSIRVRRTEGPKLPVAELEVLRFMPSNKDTWPDRLTRKNGLKQEILAGAGDPSFEALALSAHGLAAARCPIGLKDHPKETGVDWEGSLLGRETIRFRFGSEQHTLAEARETLRRTLIDGWRPGVVVTARVGDLQIREMAFAVPVGNPARPMVFIRLSIQNRSPSPRLDCVELAVAGDGQGRLSFQNGILKRGPDAVLLCLTPPGLEDGSGAPKISLPLQPGEERHVDFIHPQETNVNAADLETCRTMSFDQALRDFRVYWDRTMATETAVEVSEARVNVAIKAVLAQIFLCGDGDLMYYGSAPSVYEGGLFGIEESFPMLGLALFGYGEEAQRYMSGTYLTREFLKKLPEYTVAESESRHQQYRNGLQPHYAVSLYRLTHDEAWMRSHLPLLKDCAEWTLTERRRTMELENGQKPLHWGLLPKWAYGGDILDVLCYPFFGNFCCWRGLMDTAWVLDELGEQDTARRYRDDARTYRTCIDRAVEGSYRLDQEPPFLPLRVGGTQPDEMLDFYQLFAGCILDLEPFVTGSRHARWISDYLEESNRMFCHLPRYRPMGPGALDAIYGKGYVLNLLHDDAIRDYLLGFYAYLAFNMEHETFVSRESNVLYPSDLHQRSAYPAAEMTDPLTCASAVFLHFARHMLVTEERGEAGEYSGRLLLLAGTPRPWLQDGKTIRLKQMPTQFGPVSLELRSAAGQGHIEAHLTPPTRNSCRELKLRFRHPEHRPIRSVRVNGEPWRGFDPGKEWIVFPGNIGPCRVEARYLD